MQIIDDDFSAIALLAYDNPQNLITETFKKIKYISQVFYVEKLKGENEIQRTKFKYDR